MSLARRATSYVAAASLGVAGLILAGAPAARAETGPPEPYEEPSEGIGVPIFGLLAIAGIATVAIWQGINDAKKKKQAEEQKIEEEQEMEEYEEYFEFESEEAEESETRAPDEPAEADELAAVKTEKAE
jgi:3-hydroxy-3-methylglutaryl CoA synthase